MPNDADWLVCMDTYGPRVAYFANYWYHTFACKASVGLSYPGDSLSAMEAFFPQLISQTSPKSGPKGMFRSIGTWGMPADDGSPMADLWWSSMKSFLAADSDGQHIHPKPIQARALKTTDASVHSTTATQWPPFWTVNATCLRRC